MSASGGERATPGAVALVGSGEYIDAMRETDAWLLESVGGAAGARVALLPTASGREPGSPARWNAMGLAHFAALGVRDVRPTRILEAADARDEAQLALLRGADFFYFSGGDPQHLIESLRGSPAWEIIARAHASGAVLAGCSAGAMALSARTISIRQVRTSGEVHWLDALGIVPGVITLPHFDRMRGFMGQQTWQRLMDSLPAGHVIVGVDEDTALARRSPGGDAVPAGAMWRVLGRRAVTVFRPGDEPATHRAGDELPL